MDTTLKFECDSFSIEFSGSEEFLESRLPAIVHELTSLSQPSGAAGPLEGNDEQPSANVPGLSAVLNGLSEGTQVNKFLAAAAWLQASRQTEQMRTGDVSRAMRKQRQIPPKNCSDCLNKNVQKGFCEILSRKPIRFQVTAEGMEKVRLPA